MSNDDNDDGYQNNDLKKKKNIKITIIVTELFVCNFLPIIKK